MFADLTATIVRWRTWALMAGQDILLRYRRSVLGPFWISISMAALILAIGYLYSAVMNLPLVTYLSYLAFGLLAGPMFVPAELLFTLGLAQPLQHEIERRAGPTVLRDLAHPIG